MAQVCEVAMLVLFGLSWPFNIAKSLRSRTAKGKSMVFEVFILLGYLCGLIGKFVSGNVTYVVAFYIVDMMMVAADYASPSGTAGWTCWRRKRRDRYEIHTCHPQSGKAKGDAEHPLRPGRGGRGPR